MNIKYIYYSRSGDNGKNFGDMLTQYIYKKVIGKEAIYKKPSKVPNDDILFGAGSIIARVEENTIVWGTGIMYMKDTFKKPKKILSVRGPLTRKRCIEQGYDCPEIYGDIGLILPKFYNPKVYKIYKVGIIPHYVDFELVKTMYKNDNSIIIINVLDDTETIIDNILKCEMTISSSLHGLIVSHAYNIKSAWVKFSNKIAGHGTKYIDYYQSLNINNINRPIKIDNYKSKSEIISIIDKTINPQFPINTDHIMKVSPLISTKI